MAEKKQQWVEPKIVKFEVLTQALGGCNAGSTVTNGVCRSGAVGRA